MRKRFTEIKRCPQALAFWRVRFFWLVTSLPKNGQTKWAWSSQEFFLGQLAGVVWLTLKGNKQNLYRLDQKGGGGGNNAPVTNPLFWYFPRSLLERLEQNGHHAVMLSWLWCSFISKCSRNDVKTNQMFKLREKTFLNCFQLGFGKRLIY